MDNNLLIFNWLKLEIKEAVFSLDPCSAPGLDGFTGKVFQACWDIVATNIFRTARHFLWHGDIFSGLNNSSFIILISKIKGGIAIENFPHIVLSNFLFKIITKIISNKLGVVATKTVSPNQFGFIRDKHIEDCIALASDYVYTIYKKCYEDALARHPEGFWYLTVRFLIGGVLGLWF